MVPGERAVSKAATRRDIAIHTHRFNPTCSGKVGSRRLLHTSPVLILPCEIGKRYGSLMT
jgi:hypothetical protein